MQRQACCLLLGWSVWGLGGRRSGRTREGRAPTKLLSPGCGMLATCTMKMPQGGCIPPALPPLLPAKWAWLCSYCLPAGVFPLVNQSDLTPLALCSGPARHGLPCRLHLMIFGVHGGVVAQKDLWSGLYVRAFVDAAAVVLPTATCAF